MTSSTISVNFNDTEQKTVFTATEKCILKLTLIAEQVESGRVATFKLNSTNIGTYNSYYRSFQNINRSLANVLSLEYSESNSSNAPCYPNTLILYLEEGDTVYATRASNNAFTLSLYSAVFTF